MLCSLTSRSSAQYSVVAGNVVLTRDKSVAPSVSGLEIGNDAPLPPTGREGWLQARGSMAEQGATVGFPPVDPCHLLGGVGRELANQWLDAFPRTLTSQGAKIVLLATHC